MHTVLKQAIASLFLVFFCAFILGCASPPTIESIKAPDYSGEPKRLFVLSVVETDFGKGFSSAFHKKLIEIASNCGATLEISQVSPLELNSNVHLERMKNFNPDSVLAIARAGGTKDEYGRVMNVQYNVRLHDYPSEKIVWRAIFNNISPADGGERFAIMLTNKMREDQIFRSSCPVTKS